MCTLLHYLHVLGLIIAFSLIKTTKAKESILDEYNFQSVVSNSQPVRYQDGVSPMALDASWEFKGSLDGWATSSATFNEMQANVFHENGEMRIQFLKETTPNEAHIDSPAMFIHTSDRQSITLRYRYVGNCRYGKIRLRGGEKMPGNTDEGLNTWDVFSNSTDYFSDIFFPINGNGNWHTAYAYFDSKKNGILISKFSGNLTQMRIWPATYSLPIFEDSDKQKKDIHFSSMESKLGQSFHIDWIRLVRGPLIERITGCAGEKYYKSFPFYNPISIVQNKTLKINNFLQYHQNAWVNDQSRYKFSTVYNCLVQGGETITIEGKNFGLGNTPAHIFIDSKPCIDVKHDDLNPQQILTCKTPSISKSSMNLPSNVLIKNGMLPGLSDNFPHFRYGIAPPKPIKVVASNIAARSIDLSWKLGGTFWDQMTYTGFRIYWKKATDSTWLHNMVVGNVTITTVRPLSPDTTYNFSVAGLVENQTAAFASNLDLYGRRLMIENGLEGDKGMISAHTLAHDVVFDQFNANHTQNHSAIDKRSSLGPTGVVGGEGHYGLILVGDAHVENCNTSSFCCDDYNFELKRCDLTSLTCKSTTAFPSCPKNNFTTVDGPWTTEYCSDLPGKGKSIQRHKESDLKTSHSPRLPCGPALRLTGSNSRLRGSAWYPRQLEVGEGFDTQFKFRLSNPSFRCNNMDKVFTKCRSRGADGFAFVIQASNNESLGGEGQALGYGGTNNSLAIEFDTYYNYEELEPYENHISVQTRGWRYPNSPNHTYSLAHTNFIPDLTDGEINVRIRYIPRFDVNELAKESFMASAYTMHFFENGDYPDGGNADWNVAGIGLLYIYVENLADAVLVTPLNLDATLQLDHGRGWVGFTASTGIETWQVHDVLNWKFSSLRVDIEHMPSIV